VIGGALGILKPSETVVHCKIISDYISSSKVSRVLVGDSELINHARFYFSEDALKKFIIYPEMACTPEITKHSLNEKKERLLATGEIRYLSIASSYKMKAVDLLLEAFITTKIKGNLTLVCHDIPEKIEKKILKNKNINLIKKIPLTKKMKNQLYGNADVYINTTYIDGLWVATKALDYGMPIITNEYHRGKGLVKNKNGILINEPMKYYEPGRYGIEWNSHQEYLEQIYLLKKTGGFNDFIQQLINAFKYYEDEPLNVLKEGISSLELAEKNSLEKSNKALRNIYKLVAQEKG
jgi:glycosyltransferase involved in cell wall biosynthesis